MRLKKIVTSLVVAAVIAIVAATVFITNPFDIQNWVKDLFTGSEAKVVATAYVDVTTSITLPESEFSVALVFDFGSEYSGSDDSALWTALQQQLQTVHDTGVADGRDSGKPLVAQVPSISWLKEHSKVWTTGPKVHYVLELPQGGTLIAPCSEKDFSLFSRENLYAQQVGNAYFVYHIKDYTSSHVIGYYSNDTVSLAMVQMQQLLFIYPDGKKVILHVPLTMLDEGVKEGDVFALQMEKVKVK